VDLLSSDSPPLSELLEELGDLTLCELNELTAVWLANVQIEAMLAMAPSRQRSARQPTPALSAGPLRRYRAERARLITGELQMAAEGRLSPFLQILDILFGGQFSPSPRLVEQVRPNLVADAE
jgi:hypothetical protein